MFGLIYIFGSHAFKTNKEECAQGLARQAAVTHWQALEGKEEQKMQQCEF